MSPTRSPNGRPNGGLVRPSGSLVPLRVPRGVLGLAVRAVMQLFTVSLRVLGLFLYIFSFWLVVVDKGGCTVARVSSGNMYRNTPSTLSEQGGVRVRGLAARGVLT